MKRAITIIILFFVCHAGSSQNIILNPDFEQFTTCPTMNGQITNAIDWLEVVYSCDYMNCAFQGWTTQAVIGAQNGAGYAGFATYGNSNGAAEAFGQFLATPLIAGNSYRITFFAKRSDSGFYSNICTGVCFYGFNGDPVPGGAQTNICAGSLPGANLLGCSDTVSNVLWQSYTVDFISPANLDYLVITPGCALNCAEFIYIDNMNFTEMINYENVCFGDTTLFMMNDTTSLVSASWSFSDPASGINNTSSLFNPAHVFTSTGTFLVRVIRTYINSSVDTVIIPVTIYAQVSVNLGIDSTICEGDSILLNASGPAITDYLWQDGTTASSYTADTTGNYIVTVSNPGCSATDTFNLNVIVCTTVSAAFVTLDPFICPGTCINFINASLNASSFIWSFAGGNPSVSTDLNPSGICYNSPGAYDVQLIASDGVASDTVLMPGYINVYPFPAPQGILQSGDTLFANQGAVSYQWYQDGVPISGATDYFYLATVSGNYSVIAIDINDCEVEAVIIDVIASLDQFPVGSSQFSVYPNPVQDKFTIQKSQVTSGTACEISIYNVLGEAVFRSEDCHLTTIDCRTFQAGVYWMTINSEEKKIQVKFLKQ